MSYLASEFRRLFLNTVVSPTFFFMSLFKADGHESRGCDANIVCNILLFFFLHLCSFAHFKCLVIFVHVCHMRSCLLLCSGLPCFTVSSVLADVVCHKFEFVFFSKDEHFQDFLRVAL